MGDFADLDREARAVGRGEIEIAWPQRVERPTSAQLVGPDRELGWRHSPGQDLLGLAPVLLVGEKQGHTGVVTIPSTEERETLVVVPMEVGEQDRADEWSPVEELGDLSDPGAGVEEEGRRAISVEGQRQARGMAAIADELHSGSRGRSSDAAEVDSHTSVPAGVFASMPLGQLLESGPLQLIGIDRGDPARGDGHQRRGAYTPLEVGPLP